VNHDFQFGMPGRVPLPQGLADACRNPSHDETALSRDEMTAQSLTVRDFRFALRELGDVDVVENREAGHIRGWISGGGG
jgi:hypothetical protein